MSSPSGSPGSPRLFFFSALRFHGKNGWMSAGTRPPAAAHCSKYRVSHFRGLTSTASTWPRSRTAPPSIDHSRATPSRRSSSAHRRGPRSSHSEVLLSSGIRGSSTNRLSPSQMRPQAFQHLPARGRKIRSGQFRLHLPPWVVNETTNGQGVMVLQVGEGSCV